MAIADHSDAEDTQEGNVLSPTKPELRRSISLGSGTQIFVFESNGGRDAIGGAAFAEVFDGVPTEFK